MNTLRTMIFGSIILFSNAAALDCLFMIGSVAKNPMPISACLPVWALCLTGCWITLCLWLRRSRQARSITLIEAAFVLVQCFCAFAIYGGFCPPMGIAAALCMWLMLYVRCNEMIEKPITADMLRATFELNILALITGVFIFSILHQTPTILLPLTAAAILSLAALIAKLAEGGRSGKQDGAAVHGIAVISGLLVVMIAAAAVVILTMSSSISAAAGWIWHVLRAGAGLLARWISNGILFLASLLPEKEYGDFGTPEAVSPSGAVQEQEYLINADAVLYGIFGLIAAVVIAFAIYRILRGGGRISLRAFGSTQGLTRQRIGFSAGLKAIWRRLRRRIAFAVNCIVLRDTAPGLFAWVDRRCMSRRKSRRGHRKASSHSEANTAADSGLTHPDSGRLPGETCRAFLLRAVNRFPDCGPQLTRLADAMDARYYSSAELLSRKECADLRRTLARASRRARFSRSLK